MKKYEFRPYSNAFPKLFSIEKARILGSVPGKDMLIEHVGSSAVPNLGGKGIIDIAIAAKQEDLQAILLCLQEIGYEFRPKFSTEDRLYCVIDLPDQMEEIRRYHVHLTQLGSSVWKELIGFRDYLRLHPEIRDEYAAIKKEAARAANQTGEIYRKLKEPLFQKVKSLIEKK